MCEREREEEREGCGVCELEGGISTALLCDWKFNRERDGGRHAGEEEEEGRARESNAKALHIGMEFQGNSIGCEQCHTVTA